MTTDATILQDAVQIDDDGSGWGITCTPGRQQPYAVWYRGKIHRFCVTLEEAEKRLRAATGGLI